jgi:DeoR/GlpR family transcriptional regulator of sugar metabolism
MLAEERLDLIKRELAADGRVMAADLAVRFGVSEDTVRRDLRELARAGLCRKVYGGALAPAPHAGPLRLRGQQAADAKARLALAAVRLVSANQTLFIDAGTTNIAIARALPRDIELTVATNAPSVAEALADHPSVRVIMLGGVLDRESGACLGGATLHAISQIHADLFFLGSCGVDASLGTTVFDPGEAEVKRAMAQNSPSLVVAATTDKLATAAPFHVTDPDAITHLIVEVGAPPLVLASFESQGSRIHVAS